MFKRIRLRPPQAAGLFAANLTEVALPLVRSIALAHIIAKDQFGIAITLAAAAGMAETMGDFGIQYSAVRKSDVASPARVYATLHSVALIRALCLGAALLAAAPVIVWSLGVWEALWAYMLLGAVAVIRGFANLGVKELMRNYVFWPEALTIIGNQVVWTVGSIATAWLLGDFSCMIWGLLGGALTHVLLSHLLSPRRWRLGWDKQAAREAMVFGRPLIPNGVANAIATLGDRFIVGSAFGTAALAVWSVAISTAVLPRGMILKLLVGVFMPRFVNIGIARTGRLRLYDRWLAWLSLIAFVYALGLLAVGRPVLGFVFGADYAPSQLLIDLIALDTCIKFLVGLPVPPALAFGHTRFILWCSIAGAAALGAAALTIPWLRSLESFVLALALAEFLTLASILFRSVSMYSFTTSLSVFLIAIPLAGLSALTVLDRLLPDLGTIPRLALCAGTGLLVVGFMLAVLWSYGLPLRRLFDLGGRPRGLRPTTMTPE